MMKLIFATNNQHKVFELQSLLPPQLQVTTLQQAGIDIDIAEPHPTLEQNAEEKATVVHRLTQVNCFGEDTGLEVLALNNEPGVKSARYAGDEKSFQNNIDKLLTNLSPFKNRQAQFRTVICLIVDGKTHFFEGICAGKIIEMQRGGKGFGYDSVFVPEGANKTFAEMDINEKNLFSHRANAVKRLVAFLNNVKLNTQS